MKRLFTIFALAAMAAVVLLGSAMTPEARRSFQAFERKAEAGDPGAMYRLSAILETGFDTIAPDTVRSLALLKRSAAAGFAPACNYLGYLYQRGELLPASPDSALYWIRTAADAGDPKAAHNLAFLLLDNPDGETVMWSGGVMSRSHADSVAVEYLRRAADAGSPMSQTLLADLHVQGRGVAPDTLMAESLYVMAINQGFRDAEMRLLNLMGSKWRLLSPQASVDKAVEFWKMGAYTISAELLGQVGPDEAETARAYALLGLAFSRGLGVPYSHEKSLEYFARAVRLGNPSAQFILAETLEIFPDAAPLSASELFESAREAGITSPEQAVAALLAD